VEAGLAGRVRAAARAAGTSPAVLFHLGWARVLAALTDHEHAPLAVAQRASGVAAPAPLFTSLLNYRHSPQRDSGRAGLDGIEVIHASGATNYPVTVSVDDDGTGFALTAEVAAPGDPQQAPLS